MKRLLILFILLPMNLYAQIKVVSESSPTVEVAKVWRVLLDEGPVTIDYDGDDYCMYGETTNDFDIFFHLVLGEKKEDAVNTLRSLAELCDKPVGTSYVFQEIYGDFCDCTVSNGTFKVSTTQAQKGKSGSLLKLHRKGYIGEFLITKNQLETLARKLERYNEE